MRTPRPVSALFDDASSAGRPPMRFERPLDTIVAHTPADVRPALDRVRNASRAGFWCAGALTYEAGYALEARLRDLYAGLSLGPLLWFGVFDAPRIGSADVAPIGRPAQLLTPQPAPTRSDYIARAERVLDYIASGDIYQLNLTFQSRLPTGLSPAGVFAALRDRQMARHGGLFDTGTQVFACFSPELFFDLCDGRITARPMKGTAARQADPQSDRAAADWLKSDAKNRAENLMIVDLMRNDLTRIAHPGSVRVDGLFDIESYPTVHQMTSTVSARLARGLDAVDAIEALFPCGSITGAPKIRAMQLIRELEMSPRGIYTGSIGWIAPSGDARFNVAIRTLVIEDDGHVSIGLGSGLVADSRPCNEWEECLLKARFLGT